MISLLEIFSPKIRKLVKQLRGEGRFDEEAFKRVTSQIRGILLLFLIMIFGLACLIYLDQPVRMFGGILVVHSWLLFLIGLPGFFFFYFHAIRWRIDNISIYSAGIPAIAKITKTQMKKGILIKPYLTIHYTFSVPDGEEYRGKANILNPDIGNLPTTQKGSEITILYIPYNHKINTIQLDHFISKYQISTKGD